MIKYINQREGAELFLKSIFNSYSQVFFSDHRGFAILLMVVSFFDPFAGLSGILAVLTTSAVAFAMNFDKATIAKGLYGFNSLLTGLGLGVYYHFSPQLVFVILLASVFALFVSVTFQGVLGKYNLPYLSLPFLLAIWFFFTASYTFTTLGINERGIYTFNEFFSLGGLPMVKFYESMNNIHIPEVIKSFLVSLSAIFFQYNVLAGIFIATGILIFSRIAFMLAVLGFAVAWVFYFFLGVEISSYNYSYIGFNYILTSIAIGGFFLVPSRRSFLSVVILIPLVAVLTLSLSHLLHTFRLPVYSLPFVIITLLYLYILKFRVSYSHKLTEVYYQFNSPEKNLYSFTNKLHRFRYHHLVAIKLPFFGRWCISQAHNGEYTHKTLWRHAWDFVITDNDSKQYKNTGDYVEDYFCFNKPVLAPADGEVVTVVDDIEDNMIGKVNLKNNWGNTIIIKHSLNVYTKLSHLKQNSIEVKEGQKVKTGQVLARCGNSGRSPYPHLHFQVQDQPYIGAPTIEYPISNYIKHCGTKTELVSYSHPTKEEVVANIEINQHLVNAFAFIPGQFLFFKVYGIKNISEVKWEVKVNALNEAYLYCRQSDSYAYFENHDSLFYFTQFYGNRNGLLYYFFLGAYKIQKGYYPDVVVTDKYPLHLHFPSSYLWIQDFISPFKIFADSYFTLSYTRSEDTFGTSDIFLKSSANNSLFKKDISRIDFELVTGIGGIKSFIINKHNKHIKLERCEII